MSAKRRIATAAGGSIAALALWGACGQVAGAETAGPLGSYNLKAQASGLHALLAGQLEGMVPDASSAFETGGLGYARGSIAWPGDVGGNAGDTLILLGGGQIPKDLEDPLRTANDPIVAEARGPSGPAEASFDQVPGVVMHAKANDAGSSAEGAVQHSDVPGVGSLGSIATSASTRLDAKGVLSDAKSTVTDIDLADGVLRIESVTSTATARSDGATGSGAGATKVSGVTVAGQPATIDERGLTIGSAGGAPVSDVANQLAQSALQQAGISVVVSRPTISAEGASATASAGAVLIVVGKNDVGVILGGASASASGSPGFDESAAGADLGIGTDAVSGGSFDGGADLGVAPPSPAAVSSAPPGSRSAPVVAPELVSSLGEANPLWLAIVGAFAACLFAGALRRLGTGILDLGLACDEGDGT